jgi:hypothetical protein
MCPIKPIFASTPDGYWRAIQLASELSELSIPPIKQGARLAVGGVVMVDE